MFTSADIEVAQRRIAPYVRRTPLVRSGPCSRRLGTNAYLKEEIFQKTGAFKVRGAFNKILCLGDAAREHGIAAVSGGNHAQAVAYAARTLKLRAVIFMPEATPRNYVDATAAYGAAVRLVRSHAEGFQAMRDLEAKGWGVVHPFDDPLVMAGQGTAGFEILEDLPQVTDVIVSIGGGGLIGGLAVALKARKPDVRIWGVETEGADCMSRAIAAGRPVTLSAITSVAWTLGAPTASDATLALVQRHAECVTVVSDAEAMEALRFLLERTKILTEPAASCTLAAADRLRAHFGSAAHVVLVLCGGNLAVRDLCRFS